MARFGQKNVSEARQFLAGLTDVKFGKPISQLKPSYVIRQANAIERQLAAGLDPNRQAARGHITTPEHGKTKGAPPKVSTEYRTARATGLTPKVQRGVQVFRNGTRQYTGGRAMAREAIKDATALDKRVQVRVFNKETGRWQEAYANRGHTPGISAKVIEERAKANGVSVLEQIVADSEGYEEVDDLKAAEHDLADIFEALLEGEVPQGEGIDLGDYSLWEVDVL